MEIPDDVALTKFLIPCYLRKAEGTQRPLEKSGPKNLRKYKHIEGDLTYLETTAGGLFRYQTDIRVFVGHDPEREQIWGMQVAADISRPGLAKTGFAALDLLDFLFESRQMGYMRTLGFIETGQKFSLFDIPRHERAGIRHDSVLRYEENIDDTFDFFSGNEEITYRPGSRASASLIYRAQIQGGRL